MNQTLDPATVTGTSSQAAKKPPASRGPSGWLCSMQPVDGR